MAPPKDCASCHHLLPKPSYSANQWVKGAGTSRCTRCVHGHTWDLPLIELPDAGRRSGDCRGHYTPAALLDPIPGGNFRFAAKGIYVVGERRGQDSVVKWFKDKGNPVPIFSENHPLIYADVKTIKKALEIINDFNRHQVIDKRVVINIPAVIRFHKGEANGTTVIAESLALEEPFIEGWQRFNSNSGGVDNPGSLWSQAMQALSHILSQTTVFGNSDLGPRGISDFFARHKCNRFCRTNWAKPGPRRWDRRTPVSPARDFGEFRTTLPNQQYQPDLR